MVATSATVDIDPPDELLLAGYRKSLTAGSTSYGSDSTATPAAASGSAYIHKTSLGATLITPLAERTASPPAATPVHLRSPLTSTYVMTRGERERADLLTNARRLREVKKMLQGELETLRAAETPQEAAQFYHDRLSSTGASTDPLERGSAARHLSRSFRKTGTRQLRDFDESENEWRVERKRFCCFQWTIRD